MRFVKQKNIINILSVLSKQETDSGECWIMMPNVILSLHEIWNKIKNELIIYFTHQLIEFYNFLSNIESQRKPLRLFLLPLIEIASNLAVEQGDGELDDFLDRTSVQLSQLALKSPGIIGSFIDDD